MSHDLLLQMAYSCVKLGIGTIVISFSLLPLELRKTLQKQEEETKQREKNIDDLQNTNESLKRDLAKADKERKELAHKVSVDVLCASGTMAKGVRMIASRYPS